ncbi:TIGR02530 family flagellar biosynthesis protein [Anaerosalibacter massiliensis]|uniref:Flagellar protein n=1 Tax=Anaerosalibacter massiliensis TaxID=1347392 RepID=A0A9X2MET1_9FIRM|nr:TIGR02530 family flagellar biosynthesis protein [Anaerosalibacter massiliensis]MCR2042768.1 flagellar protein [Anaerosalibacter massiliensis]
MNRINIKQLESRLINSSTPINDKQVNSNKNFKEILEKVQGKNEEIKFSKHALERMDSRDVKLNLEEVKKIEMAFKKAEEKGVKDAFILLGDKGFIASIENKTVITSITNEELKENIFTNIDGAVIL